MKKMVVAGVRFPAELIEQIDQHVRHEALRRNRRFSRNEFIVEALENSMAQIAKENAHEVAS